MKKYKSFLKRYEGNPLFAPEDFNLDEDGSVKRPGNAGATEEKTDENAD